MKQTILNNLKNIYGWKTKRKIVVFSVDDYGNVRLNSRKARKNLDQAGLKVLNRFDAYDTLETREDLEALYEVLSSVKDKNRNPAVFTPFAIPCNINFEAMAIENNERYIYELLPDTFAKLSAKDPGAYEGAWDLWKEGIEKGLIHPQFHGREHINLKVFEEKLKEKDNEVLVNLQNRSYTSVSSTGYSTIGYTAAFAFENKNDLPSLQIILEDGIKQFTRVFGYKSDVFTPPAQQFPLQLIPLLHKYDIRAVDKPFFRQMHLANGKYKREINTIGKDKKSKLINLVRNVVFEPTHEPKHVDQAYEQVKTAFRWNKPAIISSHRVNYCGHIDAKNRKTGINALKKLLHKIVRKWPEVEFMAAHNLSQLIENK